MFITGSKQEKACKPVAKIKTTDNVNGLVLFDYATRSLSVRLLREITPARLNSWGVEDMEKMPIFGRPDHRMLLLAKEGTGYWVYTDSSVALMGLDEIIALKRCGFIPYNFCIVHAADKKTYLKLTRGTLYHYASQPADNGTWVVSREYIIDGEAHRKMYFFRNRDNAYACLNKTVAHIKNLAKQYGWTDEAGNYDCPTNPPVGYSIWRKGSPRTYVLSVTLDRVSYED